MITRCLNCFIIGKEISELNLYMLFVSYVWRSAKILILNKKGIIEKISYIAYESVDEKNLSLVMSRKMKKK